MATRPSTSLALTGRSWSASTSSFSVLVSLISESLVSAPFSWGASRWVGGEKKDVEPHGVRMFKLTTPRPVLRASACHPAAELVEA